MKKFNLVFLLLLSVHASQVCQAATIKVKKTKGHSAIIESSTPLIDGKTYTIQINENTNDSRIETAAHSFSVGMDASFFKSDQLQEHQILIEGRYGWNYIDYEYGPLAKVHMVDEGAGFNSDYLFGGYFDYNLQPNNYSETHFYGLTAQAYMGNRQFTNGSNVQIYGLGGGAFMSWYLSNSSMVLKTEGLLENKTIATSTKSSNVLGFVAKLFLTYYY